MKFNVLIRNDGGGYSEYREEAGALEDAISTAIEKYIITRLSFNSAAFPMTKKFWATKIQKSVAVGNITTAEKITLLNNTCRDSDLKIDKIFAGYSVEYNVV